MKLCTKCRRELPETEFYKSKQQKSGLKPWCKKCSVKDTVRWQKENPEKHKEKSAKWQKENPKKRIISCAKWYEKNPTHKKEWREQNPFKWRDHNKRSKLKRANSIGHSKVSYDAIIKRDGCICHICGGEVALDDIHFDHIMPLSRGGEHSEENISVSHSRCNLRKGSKTLEEYYDFNDGIEVLEALRR